MVQAGATAEDGVAEEAAAEEVTAGVDSPEESAEEAEAAAEEAPEKVDAAAEATAEAPAELESGTVDVDSMKMLELKEELAKRGLSTAGRKPDLSTRLTTALQVRSGWRALGSYCPTLYTS